MFFQWSQILFSFFILEFNGVATFSLFLMVPVLLDDEPEVSKDHQIYNQRYSIILPFVILVPIRKCKPNQQDAMNEFAWYVYQHPERYGSSICFIVIEEPADPHESNNPLRNGGNCEDDGVHLTTSVVDHVYEIGQ